MGLIPTIYIYIVSFKVTTFLKFTLEIRIGSDFIMAMTKTSAMLVEEFNAVMDNASKLVIGEKYSYPKLMETLGLPVKAKGSSKGSSNVGLANFYFYIRK